MKIKMNEQNFMKLVEKVNIAAIACKLLSITLLISLALNLVLILDLTKAGVEIGYYLKSSNTIEQQAVPVNENNKTISLTDVTDKLPTLPAIPTNLK